MVNEAVAEGSFFHAAVGPENQLVPTVLQASGKDECCAISQPQSFPYINATEVSQTSKSAAVRQDTQCLEIMQ